MSDAPSKSNADIEKPRRGIGRFLGYNAIATTAGCVALALTFDHIYILYPAAFTALLAGTAIVFREMFALLGQDSQYQVDEVAGEEAAAEESSASNAASVAATPHAA
jgi:hypothetical protein